MLQQVAAILILLVLASFVHHLGKRIKVPYTILLFILGLFLSYVLINVPSLGFLAHWSLTPELLFYVFLPVLLFEAGYNISYEQLSRNYLIIWGLAIIGVLLSTFVIGYGGYYLFHLFGREVPLLVMLLFGVVISSTDPVAVLSIFKHFGVPKRLYLIFEGESLFNDGTSVALFLIMLSFLQQGSLQEYIVPQAFLSFIVMIGGGIVLGIVIGIGFAELIKHIKYNTESEIALTMILPHTTFLLSEYLGNFLIIGDMRFHISGVIATAYTAIIMGNYGKTKITPKVEKYMDKFWSFFTFVCNSLVFLMMGMMIKDISAPASELVVPIFLALCLVLVARAISVYFPTKLYNILNIQERIPMSYQHLLVRGSLRGALGLMLALMIPDNLELAGWTYTFSVKEFILILTISTILFSLIIQGLSIKKMLKAMNLNQLYNLEKFEKYESEIMIYHTIIQHIHKNVDEYLFCKQTYQELEEKYQQKLTLSQLKMEQFLHTQKNQHLLLHKGLSLHALGIEKQYLHEMYTYNEIPEHLYHYLDQKIEKQIGRVTRDEPQIRGQDKEKKKIPYSSRDPIKLLTGWLQYAKHNDHDRYILNRTKAIISQKVIEGLQEFQQIPFGYDATSIMDDIVKLYESFHEKAQSEITLLQQDQEQLIHDINNVLLNKGLVRTEEHLVTDLFEKDIITEKIYKQFMHEIEEEVLKTY